MKIKTSRGFTLVELLVAILVIGMLIATVLPAVQQARESARRAQCVDRLVQLITAVNKFELANRHFPSGTENPSGPIRNEPAGQHYNWLAHCLPYLDQKNLFEQLDWKAGVYHERNAAVRPFTFSTLMCPTAGRSNGFSHFAAVHHDVESPIAADNHGVFFLNSKLRRDDIPDGAAFTLFLGEKLSDAADLGWLSGTRATLRNTERLQPRGPKPPIENRVRDELPSDTDPLHVGGFESLHPTVVNLAYGDGNVRAVRTDIPIDILQKLGHRADGVQSSSEP